MSLSIPAALPVIARPPAPLASLGGGKSSSAPATTAGNVAQENAALNQALGKYRAGLTQGQPASALSALARQITADAKLLGETVSLPKAPAASAATATSVTDTSPSPVRSGRLDTVV